MNSKSKKIKFSIISSLLILSTFIVPFRLYAQTGVDIPVGKYKGDYYNGKNFGTFVATREDEKINFKWANGSPMTGINNNNFSVRWEGYFFFDAGTYTFTINSDDGARVYIDDQILIDAWQQQQKKQNKATKALDSKAHKIKVEYFEAFDGASVDFSWVLGTNGSNSANTGTGSASSTVSQCVSLTASQIEGVAPFTVRFTALGSDPNGAITDYEFSLGEKVDGKMKMITQPGSQLIYTYTVPGTYTASVRIKDSKGVFKGGSGTCAKKITVVKSPQALTSTNSAELPQTGPSDYLPTFGLLAASLVGFWAYRKFRVI